MNTLKSFEDFKPWLAEAKRIVEEQTDGDYSVFLRDPFSLETITVIEVPTPLFLVVDAVDGAPTMHARISCLYFKEQTIEVLFNEDTAFHRDPIGKDFDAELMQGSRSGRIELLESLKHIRKSDICSSDYKLELITPANFEKLMEPSAATATRLIEDGDDDSVLRYRCVLKTVHDDQKSLEVVIRKVDDGFVFETTVNNKPRTTRYLQPAFTFLFSYLYSL